VTALLEGAPRLEVELYVGGSGFTLDDPTLGTLDAGNVLGPTDDGWTVATCYALSAAWRNGATDPDGPLSRMTPGYCQVRLFDPLREFDPSNMRAPFRNRLAPNTPLRLVARTEDTPAVPPALELELSETYTGSPDGPYSGGLTPDAGTVWDLVGGRLVRGAKGPVGVALHNAGTPDQELEVDLSAADNASQTAGITLATDATGNASGLRIIPARTFGTWNVQRRLPGGGWTFLVNLGVSPFEGTLRARYNRATEELTVDLTGTPTKVVAVGPLEGTWCGLVDTAAAVPSAAWYSRVIVRAMSSGAPAVPGVRVPQFSGRVYAADHSDAVTLFEATDGLSDLAAYDGDEQNAQGTGELTGARVARILEEVNYRGTSSLDPGLEELQGTTLAQPALTELWHATDSELGSVWVDRSGVLTFRDRSAWTAAPVYLETLGPADLCGIVRSSRARMSSDKVRNEVYAAAKDHPQELEVDLPSRLKWGRRRWGRNDLLLRGQAALRAWAQEVLLWSKEVRPGAVTELELNPATAPRLWPFALTLDPLVSVRLSWPDTEETPTLVGYAHSVTPEEWRTVLVLAAHPLDAIEGSPFTLDDPARGLLDSGNVVA
jgi:hypothetical protein